MTRRIIGGVYLFVWEACQSITRQMTLYKRLGGSGVFRHFTLNLPLLHMVSAAAENILLSSTLSHMKFRDRIIGRGS